VIDIYSEFVKSFHIQRGQNGHLINDRNRGREKICLKAYNHCNSQFFAIFILLFTYVCYMCLYVISCLCVYSGLGLVVSV